MRKDSDLSQLDSRYFWRDAAVHEVDGLVDYAGQLRPFEIKSSQTFNNGYLKGLEYWCKLAHIGTESASLFYAGDSSFEYQGIRIYSWRAL